MRCFAKADADATDVATRSRSVCRAVATAQGE